MEAPVEPEALVAANAPTSSSARSRSIVARRVARPSLVDRTASSRPTTRRSRPTSCRSHRASPARSRNARVHDNQRSRRGDVLFEIDPAEPRRRGRAHRGRARGGARAARRGRGAGRDRAVVVEGRPVVGARGADRRGRDGARRRLTRSAPPRPRSRARKPISRTRRRELERAQSLFAKEAVTRRELEHAAACARCRAGRTRRSDRAARRRARSAQAWRRRASPRPRAASRRARRSISRSPPHRPPRKLAAARVKAAEAARREGEARPRVRDDRRAASTASSRSSARTSASRSTPASRC